MRSTKPGIGPAAAIGLALATVVLFQAGTAWRAHGQVEGNLRPFMRQKLEYSQKILEGLTVEDYAMIAQGARALRELSQDARWRVSPNINYLRMSSEFQDLADELAEKAKQRNLDGASLAYVRMTLNCVKCHQYTRDNRLTLRGPVPHRGRF